MIYKRNPSGGSSGYNRPLRPPPGTRPRRNNDHTAIDGLFKKLDDKFNLLLDEDDIKDRFYRRMKGVDEEIDGYKKVVNKMCENDLDFENDYITCPTSTESLSHFKAIASLILIAFVVAILATFIVSFIGNVKSTPPPITQEKVIVETIPSDGTLKQL